MIKAKEDESVLHQAAAKENEQARAASERSKAEEQRKKKVWRSSERPV